MQSKSESVTISQSHSELYPKTMYHHLASFVSPLLGYLGIDTDGFIISFDVNFPKTQTSWTNVNCNDGKSLLKMIWHQTG